MIAPAKTGKERSRRTAVIKIDQANKGSCSNFILFGRILIIVVIKLIAPIIDEIPAKCNLKISKSTEGLLWKEMEDKGG